ncbi:MAG: hypothetical protein AAF384_08285 [Pseudomonadota bacterium]
MSGLGHHFENAGIASVSISLVRPHTEAINPPRALWVPFQLGRPFGSPGDVEFQKRVITAALKLLEADTGPLLADFPDDEPDATSGETSWVCPVNFAKPEEEVTGLAAVQKAMDDELALFEPWFEQSMARRGRTAGDTSGMSQQEMTAFIAECFNDPLPTHGDLPTADLIRLVAHDLKAYLTEAVSAQPGAAKANDLSDWFWNETQVGATLHRLRKRCLEFDDQAMQVLGNVLLVPYEYQRQ